MRNRGATPTRWLPAASLAGLISLAATVPDALASPESERLTREGVGRIQAGRYKEAIESFNAAVKADAKDLNPVFFQAVALNRLGVYVQARAILARLEQLGYRNAEMDFETGWAMMGTRSPKSCIQRLERFEKAAPGRGQTSEFIGRCHLMLGQHAQADAAFAEAVRRDPLLKPGVDLQMAALEQARGRPEAMRERLDAAASADTLTGRALRDALGVPPPAPSAALKPWRMGLSFSAGYNDNVIALGSTVPLPTDISRKGAAFVRVTSTGSYTHQLGPDTSATLGVSGLIERYNHLSASDTDDLFVYGDLFQRINDRVGLSFRLSGEFTALADTRFRNLYTFRPALSFRFTERSVTEVAFAHAQSNYFANVPIVFSRDGDTNAFSVQHLFQIPETRWSGALSAAYTTNRTQGTDFSFDAYGATGSVRYDFTDRLSGIVGVGYTRYDYTNPNSLAGAGFAFAREDEQSLGFVQLVGQITREWRWFAQGQKVRNRSNIPFYDYKQGVVTAGVAVDF